jgi:hypothetical protein
VVSRAAANRDLLGVEVLEQGLRELARGAELVSELGQRHRAAVAIGQGEDAALHIGECLRVVVQRLGDSHYAASVPEDGKVVRVELGVKRRLKAGIAETSF